MKHIHVIVRQDKVVNPLFEEIYIDRDGKVQQRAQDAVMDFIQDNQLQIVKEIRNGCEWVFYVDESEQIKADTELSAYGVGE